MKLALANRVPRAYDPGAFADILGQVERLLNLITDGKLAGTNNAYTAAPTTGTWVQGDFVRKSNITEAGAGGSKYIIIGWYCSASGTPGTWLEARALTGN